MISPKQYARWDPELGRRAEEVAAASKKARQARQGRRTAEQNQQISVEDSTIAGIEKRAKDRAAGGFSYPHVSPGEQGILFDMEPTEKKSEPSSTADINTYAQALHEKLQREGKLPFGNGTPLGRQVESFNAKPSLPKAEGSQGTLFQPRRYRSV